jgi:hypothetical protein
MQPETEYRARAAYCVRLAETAKSSAHRVALLEQAQTLLRMADQSARMELIVEPEDWMASEAASVGGPVQAHRRLRAFRPASA